MLFTVNWQTWQLLSLKARLGEARLHLNLKHAFKIGIVKVILDISRKIKRDSRRVQLSLPYQNHDKDYFCSKTDAVRPLRDMTMPSWRSRDITNGLLVEEQCNRGHWASVFLHCFWTWINSQFVTVLDSCCSEMATMQRSGDHNKLKRDVGIG